MDILIITFGKVEEGRLTPADLLHLYSESGQAAICYPQSFRLLTDIHEIIIVAENDDLNIFRQILENSKLNPLYIPKNRFMKSINSLLNWKEITRNREVCSLQLMGHIFNGLGVVSNFCNDSPNKHELTVLWVNL